MTQFDDETHSRPPPESAIRRRSSVTRKPLWTAVTASFVLGCAVAVWLYATDLNAPAPRVNVAALGSDDDRGTFPIKFDGAELAVAERQFLEIRRSAQGEIQSIELAVRWPPPKLAFLASGDTSATALSLRGGLFISVQRRSTGFNARDRIATMYPAYLEGTAEAGPADLTVQGFSKGTVYDGQKLYVGNRETDPVHYLCFETEQELAPALCRGERPLMDRFTLIYRFHRSHLADWRSIEETVTQLRSALQPTE